MRKRSNQQQRPAARAHGESADRRSDPLRSSSGGDGTKASTATTTTTTSRSLSALALPRADVVLAALVLSVYTRTLYPSVAGGDSGELVAESCHLGVSHPPGYPLFNLAVHAFATRLPWGIGTLAPPTIAWRANFFSAAAAVLIYHCVRQWTARGGRSLPAFTAAALFAFSPLIWTYAVGAEVFALNNLFAAALIFLLQRYARSLPSAAGGGTLRVAMTGAFVSGLALCNQHTIVLFEIPIVCWVLFTRRRTLIGIELLQITAAFLAGLLPYIYMPIAMSWNPQPGSWGDVTTLAGFFHHVRRGDYGTFRLFSTNEAHEGLWTRLWLYKVDLTTREVPLHLALPVLAIGILSTLMQQPKNPQGSSSVSASESAEASRSNSELSRAVGWLVLFTYAFYMIVFHSLANLPLSEGLTYGVHMRFWQQPNVIVFIWLGVGFDKIIATWYSLCDQSAALYIRNYARALLDPLPRDAILFVNFDLQWTSLRYLQRCEQRRTDVTILNLSLMSFQWFASKHAHYPTLSFPGTRLVPFGGASNGFTFASFLDANYEPLSQKSNPRKPRRGIFFGGKLNSHDHDFQHKYTFVPFGLLDEIHRKDEVTTAPQLRLKQWYTAQQRVMAVVRDRLPVLPPSDHYSDETWEWTIARDYGMKTLSWSTYLLERTIAEDPHNVTLLSAATLAMERSYQFEPPQFWNAAANLKNLGLAYAQIVKSSKEFASDDGSDPFLNDVVGASVGDKSRFKDRASARMLEVWDRWLQLPDARRDPGFAAIESVVRKFLPETSPKTSREKTTPTGGASRKKSKSKRKTKRKPSTSHA